MMRNPETRSNPYRVPAQPAQLWIKILISVLVLLNALLIGAVAYIYFDYSLQCPKTCGSSDIDNLTKSSSSPRKDKLLNDDAQTTMFHPEEPLKHLAKRIDNTEKTISRLQLNVRRIEKSCSKQAVETETTGVSVHIPKTHRLWTAQQSSISHLETKVESLSHQLKQHMNVSHQVCKKGHYRYGMLCLYIGEAALTQSDSKSLCENDVKGHLVIVKDQLMHEFLATKLPNPLHSYWVGIERQPLNARDFKYGIENSRNSGHPDVAAWEYMDGTKVQDGVWQIWGYNRAKTDFKRCVGMSYSEETRRWVWNQHDCQERLNFICQYFILSQGI